MLCKRYFPVAAALLLALGGCHQPPPREKQPPVRLTNPGGFAQPDAAVVIRREEWERSRQEIADNAVLVFRDSAGQPVPSQLDDLDGDGRWDEIALLYAFAPRQQVGLFYDWVDSAQAPVFPKRTHIYLGKWDSLARKYIPLQSEDRPTDHHRQLSGTFLYQMEGPTWENDRIAFRQYLDERNQKDIYGKRISRMYLENIGAPGTPSYHELHDWGMDILAVGNSLSAGGLGLRYRDTLYALGPSETAHVDMLADGPVRSVLRISQTGFHVADTAFALSETISIWAGVSGYGSAVTLQGPLDSAELLTGVPDLKEGLSPLNENYGNFGAYGTYGRQSENGDNLGMAVVFPNAELAGKGRAARAPVDRPGLFNTFYVRLKSEPQPVRFYFYAGWEQSDKRFATRAGFAAYVKEQAARLNNPILVEISRKGNTHL
ncbi:DUF4861 domain-containing protein [Compostibacter hankyongensis]|uniref:DUF4861 domain-containing protein n=1 Tax=Compostibacter hankyongensis TaxID=1007089 RepID=A0ABP8FD01_9BACT